LLFIIKNTVTDQSKHGVLDGRNKSQSSGHGDGFGGLKKGFLFNSKPKSSATSGTSLPTDRQHNNIEDGDIPFIKPNKESSENSYRFSEVQQSMKVDNAFSLNKGN